MNRKVSLTHCLCADGLKSSMPTIPEFATGNYDQEITECETGYEGECMFPARLDHSHPLNVMSHNDLPTGKSENDYLKPPGASGATGWFGEEPYYARVDHVHPMSANDSTPNTLPHNTSVTYGSGDLSRGTTEPPTAIISAEWNRGSTVDSQGKKCGVKFKVITSISRTKTTPVGSGTAYQAHYYWRELEFDENGGLKKVSGENLGTYTMLFKAT